MIMFMSDNRTVIDLALNKLNQIKLIEMYQPESNSILDDLEQCMPLFEQNQKQFECPKNFDI